MTSSELRKLFNDTYGLYKWPETFEVDHETYANICQETFNFLIKIESQIKITGNMIGIPVSVGPNNGIMFKNVELILKK